MAYFFQNVNMHFFCTKTRLARTACYNMTNHVNNSSVFRFLSDFSASKGNYFSLARITGIVSRVPTS